MAIQTSPMTIEGTAGRSADHCIAVSRLARAPDSGPAEQSSATGVADVARVEWRAMIVDRRRRIVGQGSSRGPGPAGEGGAAFRGRLWARQSARQAPAA